MVNWSKPLDCEFEPVQTAFEISGPDRPETGRSEADRCVSVKDSINLCRSTSLTFDPNLPLVDYQGNTVIGTIPFILCLCRPRSIVGVMKSAGELDHKLQEIENRVETLRSLDDMLERVREGSTPVQDLMDYLSLQSKIGGIESGLKGNAGV